MVDYFSKMANFILLGKNGEPTDLVDVILREVWKVHEFSSNIVLDRDAKLTSTFWEALMVKCNVKR